MLSTQPFLARWSGLEVLAPGRVEGALEVRSLTARAVVRVRGPHSLVQLRLLPATSGVTVAFHEDHLASEADRTARKEVWEHLLAELAAEVSQA